MSKFLGYVIGGCLLLAASSSTAGDNQAANPEPAAVRIPDPNEAYDFPPINKIYLAIFARYSLGLSSNEKLQLSDITTVNTQGKPSEELVQYKYNATVKNDT